MTNQPKVTVITPDKAQKMDIERVFSQLGEGYKLQVIRKDPVWCDGTLITEEIDPNEPLSIDDIRKRWGGRRLQLKILNPDGSYLKSTTISFPDPPRKEGIEMVVGPDGLPTTADKLKAISSYEQQNQAPPAPPDNMQTMLLQTLIQAQATQNQSMQNMLVERVNHLEGLLENRSQAPAVAGGPAFEAARPYDTLKDTIKMIKEMEQLKAIMGAAQGAQVAGDGGSIWTGTIEKIVDLMLEKERANIHAANARALAASNIPPLPPPETPAAAAGSAQGAPSDIQLIENLRGRLASTDAATKAELLQAILGDDLDEVLDHLPEDPENDACDDNETDLDSSILSAEDSAQLNGEDLDGAGSTHTDTDNRP